MDEKKGLYQGVGFNIIIYIYIIKKISRLDLLIDWLGSFRPIIQKREKRAL